MITRIQIFLTITAAATSSFLQTPSNQLESDFNSTFLTRNEKLFKPIIIPNISEPPQSEIIKNNINAKESEEEDSKAIENPLKFSSRYSSKGRTNEEDEKVQETTEIPDPTSEAESKSEEIPKAFSDRSDITNTGEDRKDSHEYESKEESEETEIEPTEESPSYRKYLEKDSENHESSTTEETSSEEKKEEEEEETEEKRSVDDYYNSGSKNYHSIQTPLSLIKYQGRFRDEYESDRKRIVSPIRHRPVTHNWPYSRPQLENINEISENDENYEKELDEGIKEEVKSTPKQQELESAEEKDRKKFDRGKKYNYIELRDRRKQQQKALAAEEEKDDQKPLFQSFKQYQVDEEEATQQPKDKPFDFNINETPWGVKKLPTTTPKNLLRVTPTRRLKIYQGSKQGTEGSQFLGPVVFSQYLDQQKTKQEKEEPQNPFLKGLEEKEKLDQDNLSNQKNQKYQKSFYRSKETQSFNHLKESDDMYNAILANIQSVFGLRIKPLKSGTRSRKGTTEEVNLDESRALTWSLPLKNNN